MSPWRSLLFGAALLGACDDVTPVSIELVFPEEASDPFANIQTLTFGASDGATNTITQSFPVDTKRLKLPLLPYGENWVFSLEGRFEDTPLAFGKSIPITLDSQDEINVKIFFGQINTFHISPSQAPKALSPLMISSLPPLPVDVCALSRDRFGFIGEETQTFDAAQLAFVTAPSPVSRLGSSCASLPVGALVIGGASDESATELIEEIGQPDPEVLSAERTISPNLARIGHQTSTVTIPAGQSLRLPDGTVLPEGTSLILVTGGENSSQLFDKAAIVLVSPTQDVSIYSPTETNNEISLTPRVGHSATLFQSDNTTKLLLAGGIGKSGALLNTTECLDLSTFATEPGPPMLEARAGHSAILTANGDVIFIGGQNAQQESLASIERFSPRFGSFVAEVPMIFSRRGHSATLLENGLILIAGGIGKRLASEIEQPLTSGELFNPEEASQSGTIFTRQLNTARVGHAAVLMPNGAVLLVGGTQDPSQDTEIYIPVPEGQ